MKIASTRFGALQVEDRDILTFPHGLIGLADYTEWLLLADGKNAQVAWLQAMDSPEIAVPVVNPKHYAPSYQVRLAADELRAVGLEDTSDLTVLGVVSKDGPSLTLNLKAPIILNLDRQVGRQIITLDEQPIQMELVAAPVTFRRSA